ncbi:hypothetical protein K503DRAFT_191489 [Rhizopogon vinicolor AM-OR11-026]|uniref:Uncharacterized protein n=1 Tax=Rhizopogon vinicolor AM-OR11-026 TaxID=1314800 RepID=A0A1B7MZD6_9AGAM|nr:hypothetical protein K503DRAFT_191489 [Rhizopogon vinicolor AM-OR11-026]
MARQTKFQSCETARNYCFYSLYLQAPTSFTQGARKKRDILPNDEVAMDIEDSESIHPPTHPEEHPPELVPRAAGMDEDVHGMVDDLANSLCCDLGTICHARVNLEQANSKPAIPGLSSSVSQENVDHAKTSAALSCLVSKMNFNTMQVVVEQFNLGFIVARWQKCKEREGLDH